MKVGMKLSLHNYFDVELQNTQTGEIRRYKAYNTVTDLFYKRIFECNGSSIGTTEMVCVGTGTGTITESSTSIFATVNSGTKLLTHKEYTCISPGTFRRISTAVFGETDALGNLTEIGVGSGNTNLATHAFFTDSEGNPITIEKTNTDRLTVTVTIYSTVSVSGAGRRGTLPMSICYDYADSDYWYPSRRLAVMNEVGLKTPLYGKSAELGAGSHMSNLLFGTNPFCDSNSFSTALLISGLYEPIPGYFDASGFTGTIALNWTSNTKTLPATLRYTLRDQIKSTNNNCSDGRTFEIKSMNLYDLLSFTFPNHSVFPPKELEFTLVGDGVTTGFNLGVPELMAGDSNFPVTVTIDGVATNAYTFNGKDFTLKQAWCTADNKYLVGSTIRKQQSRVKGRILVPFYGTSMSGGYIKKEDGTLVYDFELPKAVNTLQSEIACVLEYSNDQTTWTEAARITTTNVVEPPIPTVVTFNEISARYWRVTSTWKFDNDSGSYSRNNAIHFAGNFDKVTPQIEFSTPPANGVEIKVKAYTEYPLKNANWLIDDIVFDLVVDRGD